MATGYSRVACRFRMARYSHSKSRIGALSFCNKLQEWMWLDWVNVFIYPSFQLMVVSDDSFPFKLVPYISNSFLPIDGWWLMVLLVRGRYPHISIKLCGREFWHNHSSSHNHGSVENGCIFNISFLSIWRLIFHWTMIMGERIHACGI